MPEKLSLGEITYIQRAVVGPTTADRIPSQEEINAQMDFINRCLGEGRGQLVGSEKGLIVVQTSDQQLVIQHSVYHIGFKRKPSWLDHYRPKSNAAAGMPDFVKDKMKL